MYSNKVDKTLLCFLNAIMQHYIRLSPVYKNHYPDVKC